jgi:hypothetical protein
MTFDLQRFGVVIRQAALGRRGSEAQLRETFKTFQFGKDRHFQGQSEYDAQYSPKSVAAPAHPAAHQLTAAMDAKYSAANPIVPPAPPAHDALPVRPKVVSAPHGKGPKQTENTASYRWPDKSRLSGAAVPVRHSQKSSVVLGVNHPAFRNKKDAAGKPLFMSARRARAHTDGPARASADAKEDAFPESDFQSACGEAKEGHDEGKEDSGSKYHLMSQEIRDRRAGNTSRSDYTTGVLSSTTRSSDATLNRNAPGAQQFHVSNQFDRTASTSGLRYTGAMSADSLAVAGAPTARQSSAGSLTGGTQQTTY